MAVINIIYGPGVTPTVGQRGDIDQAALAWQNTIQDAVSLDIQVIMCPMQPGLNAQCIPGIVQHNNMTLTRAQAKLLGVPIVDPAQPPQRALDMIILVDSQTSWVTGSIPPPVVGHGQYSLLTTMLHEMCHGLGVLGLCNVGPNVGIYSDTALINLLPNGVAPPSFFPPGLQTGFNWRTPFARQFVYQGALAGQEGIAVSDYAAFMAAPGSILVNAGAAGNYTLLTANNDFVPFTTCDHIDNDPNIPQPFLMSHTTAGQFMAAPDASSRAMLRRIGWNC
jgi:hypothetical protein